MWPWFRTRIDRWINRLLLQRQLTPLIEESGRPVLVVTTIPIVADLIGRLPVERWVYYCVDDFSKWPGLDQEQLDRMERQLTTQVHEIIAVSETLRQRLESLGRKSHLLTHGVDLEFWSHRGASGVPELSRWERPLVVFWGVIDRRLDSTILRRLSSDLSEGTIVLVGPQQDPDPAIKGLPRVAFMPAVEFERLPSLAREASVLIMPYADLPVTRAMQPLKLKEYLATDRPVVVSHLPATKPWSAALDLADTPEDFTAAVRERLRSGLPSAQREARSALVSESWSAKADLFEQWVLGPLQEDPDNVDPILTNR
jgi:hypothetical protein